MQMILTTDTKQLALYEWRGTWHHLKVSRQYESALFIETEWQKNILFHIFCLCQVI